MKIFNINFAQNTVMAAPKRNNLAPLAFDTVTFSARRPKDIPYSVHQKEREIEALKGALNEAIQNGEDLTPEQLSEKTGLDIYVVKLRLSTSGEIRTLCNEMKEANSVKAEGRKETKARILTSLLQHLQSSNQKLTDNEMAFYIGAKKDELLELLKGSKDLSALYEACLLKIKPCPTIERKAQITNINKALRYISRKDSYESISKRTELNTEIIRARISENDETFNRTMGAMLYPPDIYPQDVVEKQDDKLIDTMLLLIRSSKRVNIEDLAKEANLYPGTVLIRFKNNVALRETYGRMWGVDDDED